MTVTEKKISELKPYKNNPKRHSKQEIDEMANSLEAFGWQTFIIIDSDNVIVAGHKRYKAAKQLAKTSKGKSYSWNDNKPFDWNMIPCKYADKLTEEEIRAYRLVDNRMSGDSYDLNVELAEMQELDFDLEPFGIELFDMEEIEEVDSYDENNDDREYFSTTFTFPAAKKKQIMAYLRKHKDEITQNIIDKAG